MSRVKGRVGVIPEVRLEYKPEIVPRIAQSSLIKKWLNPSSFEHFWFGMGGFKDYLLGLQ